MAKRAFELPEIEVAAFRQAEQPTREVRELKRLQAVRLDGRGEPVATLQRLVGGGPVSACQWARASRRGGLAALQTQWRAGNANQLTAEQRQDLFEKVEPDTPEQLIAAEVRLDRGVFWSGRDLQIVVEQGYGVS